MSILVVGSVAFDDVKTPFGEGRHVLGGSATHFSMAASFFTHVRLVAVVGEDFGEDHRRPLLERNVDLGGLETAAGRTFRWAGEYGEDLNNPRTLDTQLNVFADFNPRVPERWRDAPVLFLANIDPDLQSAVLDQAGSPQLVAADTMNYWIGSKPEALWRLLRRIGVLLINDAEIRQLTGRKNLVDAADAVRAAGPEVVVVKRGEHGVLVFAPEGPFGLPAYPLRRVVDPTGAGDAFAGGFLGYTASRLAATGPTPDWRRAAVMGSVLASFQVEDFSFDRLRRLTDAEIRERYRAFHALTRFDLLDD